MKIRMASCLVCVAISLSLVSCSGGSKNCGSSSGAFRSYGAIGSLGLPGLTYDIAFGNGRVYQNYLRASDGFNVVFADNADRTGTINGAEPLARITYPSGAPGSFPKPREPFSLALTREGFLYVGVLSADHPTTPNTVEKFNTALVSGGEIQKVAWDPLAANPGLVFNFTPAVGVPLIAIGEDGDTIVANPDFIPPQYSVGVDKLGNVYVVDAEVAGGQSYQVRKFRAGDATLDPGFGTGGRIVIGKFGNIAVDDDGNIYIAYTDTAAALSAPGRASVKRFSPLGIADTSFNTLVQNLELANTSEYDTVPDVAVLGTGTGRRVYVLEYRRTNGLKQSFVHVLDSTGKRLSTIEALYGGIGIDARNLAVEDAQNFRFNVAFGAFYADSGGWGRHDTRQNEQTRAADPGCR